MDCLRIYRKACTINQTIQNLISDQTHVHQSLEWIILLKLEDYQHLSTECLKYLENAKTFAWQFLCNLCVGNEYSQRRVWQLYKNVLYEMLNSNKDLTKLDYCRMIIYNIYKSQPIELDKDEIFKILVNNLSGNVMNLDKVKTDFLELFLEHFICVERNIIKMYAGLSFDERILLLTFIEYYIRSGGEQRRYVVSMELVYYLCDEFLKKSDCALKAITSDVDLIEPQEVMTLLDCITTVSTYYKYKNKILCKASVFLNICGLLQAIHSVGKNSDNIFTPLSKLNENAPNSSKEGLIDIEQEVSYQMKFRLVKAISCFVYENKKNQDYVRFGSHLLIKFNLKFPDFRPEI